MGLNVQVYRDNLGDCTNGGASATADAVCVINMDGPFNPSADRPAFKLIPGAFSGTAVLVPVDRPEGMIGPMFGGNMAHSSDSRFSKAVENLTGHRFYGALPIHDRFDTQADYDALTR